LVDFLDDISLNDSYSDDSDDDPVFIPSGSSENLTSDDDSEYSDNDISRKPKQASSTNENVPGPSCSFQRKLRKVQNCQVSSPNENVSGPSCSFQTKRRKLEKFHEEDLLGSYKNEMKRNDIQELEFEHDTETVEQENAGDEMEGGDQLVHEERVIDNEHRHPLRDLSTSVWGPPTGNHLEFEENFDGGIRPEWHAALQECEPVDYYLAFVDLDIIDLVVNQTNIYATRFVMDNRNISNNARVQNWEPTTAKEIIHLIGLLGYMGIVRMNSLRDYWSRKWILKTDVARSVMSRNRFEILLKMLHFSDNEQCREGDHLYKVQPLLDMLIKNYQAIYSPGKKFCIDETMVPYQGRLIFRQYNPQKAHKYGIKIFTLCCDKGYTWNMSVYAG
jgi:hypothetical protein